MRLFMVQLAATRSSWLLCGHLVKTTVRDERGATGKHEVEIHVQAAKVVAQASCAVLWGHGVHLHGRWPHRRPTCTSQGLKSMAMTLPFISRAICACVSASIPSEHSTAPDSFSAFHKFKTPIRLLFYRLRLCKGQGAAWASR